MRLVYLFGVLVLLGAGCLSAPIEDTAVEVPVEDVGIPPAGSESEDVGTLPATSTVENEPADEAPSLLVPVDPDQPDTDVGTEPAPSTADESVVEAPSVVSFVITARQWSFEPSTITVKKGDTVRLSVTSIDVRHGFKLPTFGVNAVLEPDQTTVIEFTADQSGSFSFFCNVFCGDGHGAMAGTLIVAE